jgi:hypothetical protein
MAKTFILHDESVNRLGFWAKTDGIDLSQFKKNPVMYFMHIRPGDEGNDHRDMILPLGYWENIRTENGVVLADPVFDQDDEFAKRIEKKVENGIIKMASIALRMPFEFSSAPENLKPGQTRPTLMKSIAQEGSIADIGSNNNAFRLYDEDGQMIALSDSAKCAIPLIEQSKPNLPDMKKVFGLLKLADDANEAEAYQAVVKLNDKVTTLEADNKKLSDEVIQLKQSTEADNKVRVKTLIDGAVKDRKILEASRADYVALAEKDFDNTRKILDGMPVMTKLADTGSDAAKSKFEGKTWKDLDKAGQLEELKLTDISKFKELFKGEFGKEYQG